MFQNGFQDDDSAVTGRKNVKSHISLGNHELTGGQLGFPSGLRDFAVRLCSLALGQGMAVMRVGRRGLSDGVLFPKLGFYKVRFVKRVG